MDIKNTELKELQKHIHTYAHKNLFHLNFLLEKFSPKIIVIKYTKNNK